jgi:hypothetical protein
MALETLERLVPPLKMSLSAQTGDENKALSTQQTQKSFSMIAS